MCLTNPSGAADHNICKDYDQSPPLERDQEKYDCDMVGPPDPVSNIRPLRLREPTSDAEKEVQKLRLQIWAMKHHFWMQHNTEFKQEKSAFVKELLRKKRASGKLTDVDDDSEVTSEEVSGFYKDFLDRKYEDQMTFTRRWMKLNILLTWIQFKYKLQTLFGYTR